MFLGLKDVQWNEFFIEDLAVIKSGVRLTKADMSSGFKPFIGSTDSHNGITNFVSDTNRSEDSNVLGVNYNGSVVENFYHPYTAIFSDDVKRLSLKQVKGNKYHYLSLKNSILMQKGKYQYGYKFNEKRLSRQKIMLPSLNGSEPHWQFMHDYTRALMKKKQAQYIEFCRKELATLRLRNIVGLKDKEWREFFIGGKEGIFTISSTSSGIDKNKLITDGDSEAEKIIPYITRTNENNGINLFVPQSQQEKFKKNASGVITIGLDTQTVFYQPHEFFTGQNIQVLHHDSLNKWNSLFLIPLLKIQMDKFNWGGNGATLGRLNRTKIMLPIKENDSPDFEYMGQYMMNLEHRKRKQYIDHIQREK